MKYFDNPKASFILRNVFYLYILLYNIDVMYVINLKMFLFSK